jgi:hypothetical protein
MKGKRGIRGQEVYGEENDGKRDEEEKRKINEKGEERKTNERRKEGKERNGKQWKPKGRGSSSQAHRPC